MQYSGTGITFNDASTQTTAPSGFGFKNRIINGAMMIDQRNAGASVALSSTQVYTLDRFAARTVTGTGNTAIRSTTAPTGFINSLLITIGTGASPAAGDNNYVLQPIEGLNISDLAWGTINAATVTLSFWVRSSLTGTFSGVLRNSDGTRSYPFTYTISSANTFEQKSVTVAGDTTGTWLTTNGTGIGVWFDLGSGSTYQGTAGSWASADYRAASGATKLVATSGATLYITGVQLEKGSTATSFDYRPYGTELALCQRYFEVMYPAPTAVATGYSNTSVLVQAMKFSVEKRAAPTFTTNASGLTATWTPTGTQMAAFTLGGVSQISGSGTWGINGSATTSQISLSCVAATTFANCSSTTVMVHGGTGVQFNFAAEL